MNSKSAILSSVRALEFFLWCLLFVFFINAFGFLTPAMPAGWVDPSWAYGLNQAVAQGLIFGKDLIFTCGPYASIYTHMYHPATVWMMVLGIALVDVLYLACFAWLVKDAKWRWPWILACILAVPLTTQDAFLFSVPLLVGLVTFKLEFLSKGEALTRPSTQIAVALAFASLGLLPLIKGTLLVLTSGICVACSAFLLAHRKFALSLICLIAPVVSMAALWAASGQPLTALPGYLSSLKLIISGYSEAMAETGPGWQLALFVLCAGVILLCIGFRKGLAMSERGFLLLIFALFLFVGFKAGFVRQDGHFLEAMNCLPIGALFLPLVNTETRLSFNSLKLLSVALLVTILTGVTIWHMEFAARAVTVDPALKQSLGGPALDSLTQLRKDLGVWKVASTLVSTEPIRLAPWNFRATSWRKEFDEAKQKINNESGLDFPLSGTVDIYSFQQASLLAKGFRWDPRPIFQSYSAYAPELIRLNEQHLRSAGAPDNLVFRLQTIDHRLPSLDDGLSWPAMLDNYTVARSADNWIYLTKKSSATRAVSQYVVLGNVRARLGTEVPVPTGTGQIYVEVHENPSTLGKLISLIYKAPPLTLRVTRHNGETSSYRVNANMMQTGFFLSPLVVDNDGFVRLFDPSRTLRDDDLVKSIALMPLRGQTVSWSKTYDITFKQYEY